MTKENADYQFSLYTDVQGSMTEGTTINLYRRDESYR